MVMKYRVIRSSVTVTGRPAAIWSAQMGNTEHAEPRTLPNRTMLRRVSIPGICASDCVYISASRLVAPMTFTGFTALSDEMSTNRSAPTVTDASAIALVPNRLFVTACAGWSSINGTCLCAAAWNTTWGWYRSSNPSVRDASTTSCKTATRSISGYDSRNARSISNSAFSARSMRTIRLGW